MREATGCFRRLAKFTATQRPQHSLSSHLTFIFQAHRIGTGHDGVSIITHRFLSCLIRLFTNTSNLKGLPSLNPSELQTGNHKAIIHDSPARTRFPHRATAHGTGVPYAHMVPESTGGVGLPRISPPSPPIFTPVWSGCISKRAVACLTSELEFVEPRSPGTNGCLLPCI